MSRQNRVQLSHFGDNERAAIRGVLTLFHSQGWRDSHGAALKIAQTLVRDPDGASAQSLAAGAPSSFLVENAISRKRLQAALERVSETPSA